MIRAAEIDPLIPGDLLSAALRTTRDAEVFWGREEALTGAFVEERAQSGRQEAEAISLRVISGGRLGYVTHAGAPARLDAVGLVKRATSAAAEGRPAPPTFWKERESGIEVATFDDDLAALDAHDLERLARQAATRLRDMLGDVPAQVAVRRLIRQTLLMTRMSERHAQKTILQFQMRIGPVADTGACYTETWAVGRMPDDPLSCLGNIVWKAAAGQTSETVSEGRARVVLGPRAVAVALRWWCNRLTGTAVLDRQSRFDPAWLDGEAVIDPRLTVIDNPTRPWTPPSGTYDAEGLPRARRTLVERGVLRSFLLDLSSAHALELEPTASAGRDLDTPPAPHPSFIELAPGEEGFDDLLAACEGGVYVDSLSEAEAPDAEGNFEALAPAAFRIRGGRPSGWLEGLRIRANVYDLFRHQVRAVGGDRVAGPSACCGSIAFDDIEVG